MTRALLAFLLVACADTFAPEGAVRFDPPPAYRVWWDSAQACIQKPSVRRFEDIEWFSVDQNMVVDGVEAIAYAPDHRVYITDWNRDVPLVIVHELVHAIDGIAGHPDAPFRRCGLMPGES